MAACFDGDVSRLGATFGVVATSKEKEEEDAALEGFVQAALDYVYGRESKGEDLEWLVAAVGVAPKAAIAKCDARLRETSTWFADTWRGEYRKDVVAKIRVALQLDLEENVDEEKEGEQKKKESALSSSH